MNKLDFLAELEKKLQPLPDEERGKALEYYFEIIDDRMDCGVTEEEAVSACGDIDEIAEKIIMDTPLTKLVRQKSKNRRRMRAWEIVLLAVGSPLWISLGAAAFCVLLAMSIVLWCAVLCVFVAGISFGASALATCVAAVVLLVQGKFMPALVLLGTSLICAGLTMLFFLAGKWTAKGVAKLHKLTFRGIKRCFIRKEAK